MTTELPKAIFIRLLDRDLPLDFTAKLLLAGIIGGPTLNRPGRGCWVKHEGGDPLDMVKRALEALEVPAGTAFEWTEPRIVPESHYRAPPKH